MSNLTINKEVRNGIEFWVSNDASQVGMSLSGLSAMTGTDLAGVARLIESYRNLSKLPSEQLETLRSKGLQICDVPGLPGKPVKFIPAELCAAVIEYYALDAKRVSPEVRAIALANMRLFNKVGMKMFILNQVGYKVTSPEQQDISQMLSHIVKEMSEMKELTKRYVHIKEATKSRPGLDEILEQYERGYLLTSGDSFTIATWLKAKGVDLTQKQKISLGLAISMTYRTHKREVPITNGQVRFYTADDIPLLESALKNL